MKNLVKKASVVVLLLLCLPMLVTAEVSGQSPITTQKSNTQIETTTTTNSKSVSVQSNSVQTNSAQSEPKLNTLPGTGSWQELGPTPIANPNNVGGWGSAPFSGRVTSIAVNGSNPQEIYVGAAQGGVWKSLDGGNHWTPLMDSQASLAVGSIAISPDNSTIYVGTGEGNHNSDGYYGAGLLKSTDEGKTWTTLGANYFNGSAITSIIINSANPNYLLVSTTSATFANGLSGPVSNPNGVGAFLSTDGGSTWALTLNTGKGITNGVASMVANVTNPNIVFAGDFNGTIWDSTNGGASWSMFIYSTSSAGEGRVALAVTLNNPSYLYVLQANSTGDIYSIYVYDSSTGNFLILNSALPVNSANQYGPCGGQCYYNLLISVSPTDVNTIYVGTNNLYKSTDGGSTWTFLGGAEWNGNLHPDQHALVFSPNNPNTIYSGNDGGIWKSTDGGSTWINLNSNLGITQFNSISASPTNDTHLIGGAQDNACPIYTNSTGWTFSAGGDGAASLFFNNTAMACNYVNLKPRFSFDNGQTFITATNGINQNDQTQFIAPMVQDPSNPDTLYLGSNRIYKTSLTSSSWTDISGVISTGSIISIAVSKTNGNVIYEGDDQGIVKVSTNGGSTWNQILSSSSLSSIGTTVPVTSVAVDPFNSSIVMVAFAVQNNPEAMVFSLNQGSTWLYASATQSLGVAINVIKFNPVTDIPFVGTDSGVYLFNGNNYKWYTIGAGLPNVAIFDLAFTASNYLIAGTHGRGAWLNYITPFVTLNSLRNNTFVSSGSQVSVSITDANGFSNGAYYWDSNTASTTTGTIATTIPSGEGQHILHVSAQDSYGNWRNVTFVINLDDVVPTINLPSTFTNTTLTSGSTITLRFNNSFNIPIDTIMTDWNESANITIISGGTGTNGNLTLTIPSGSGLIYLHVYIMDTYGKWTAKTFVFKIQPKQKTTPASTPTSSSSNTPTKSKSSPGFEAIALLGALGIVFLLRKRNR